jgi:rhodanese-related sulfurtransferase
MQNNKLQKLIVPGVVILGIFLGVALNFSQDRIDNFESNGNDWRNTELIDVRDGSSYTINDLQKPALLETFAVWCHTCTRQQQEIKNLKQNLNITSISLNVDPNEDSEKVRDHIENNRFNWRYSVSPSKVTQSLIDRFNPAIAQPPSAPVVLICENNSRKLENGVKPASKLRDEINKGC